MEELILSRGQIIHLFVCLLLSLVFIACVTTVWLIIISTDCPLSLIRHLVLAAAPVSLSLVALLLLLSLLHVQVS